MASAGERRPNHGVILSQVTMAELHLSLELECTLRPSDVLGAPR